MVPKLRLVSLGEMYNLTPSDFLKHKAGAIQ